MTDNNTIIDTAIETRDKKRFTFPKSERLRHKGLVDPLFERGKKCFEYPVRVMYKIWTEEELQGSFKIEVPAGIAPLQVMITIPKRKIRHAVDRVLLRRRVREAWRLHRGALRSAIEQTGRYRLMGVGIIYMADEVLPMSRIEPKIKKIINRLIAEVTAE